MEEARDNRKDKINFLIDEEKEFLNIINYKNIHYVKSGNYIYIGQLKNEENLNEEETYNEKGNNKENEKLKNESKEYEQKQKSHKKKKKKTGQIIKEGYGILLKVKRNWNNDEIIENKFIGSWKNDKKNGLGFQIFSNKYCFYGMYENNCINGWGHLEWNDGSKFEGTWKDNKITDKGIYKNNNMLYEGNFYDNKLVNHDGTWINLFESKTEKKYIEKKYKEKTYKNHKNNILLQKDINLLVLSFDFVKTHLKKICNLIRQNFNTTPFILCSHQFIKDNKNFSLINFVFLSFYLDTNELLLDHNQQLFFKRKTEEESGNLNDQLYKKEFTGEYHFKGKKDAPKNSNESNALTELDESSELDGSSELDESSELDKSSELNESSELDEATDSPFSYDINDKEEPRGYHGVKPKKNDGDAVNNTLCEYIKNACQENVKDIETSSSFTQFSSNFDEIEKEKSNSLYIIAQNSASCAEKKKNEINKLISNYTNLYIDTDDTSSCYSAIFSEYEMEEERNDLEDERTVSKKKKETEIAEKNNLMEKKKKWKPMQNKCEMEQTTISTIEQIEIEISKIKIDMTFLKNIRNLNIPCEYFIKKKMKKSLFLKYPFFWYLNISDEDKINVTSTSNLLLQNFDIPEFWYLQNFFGMEPLKLSEDIFNPYHLERSNYLNNILHFSSLKRENTEEKTEIEGTEGTEGSTNANVKVKVNTKQIEKKKPFFAEEYINFNNLNLNMLILTDLVVDRVEDVTYLKNLIKEKFKKWGNVYDFFFIIIS